MGPIFNEKISQKWNLWIHKQCTICTDWLKKRWEKSNFAATVHARYINSSCKVWFFLLFFFSESVHTVYYLWTHKFHFSTIFSLKIGPTILFTHLKIILLQYFSVFSFSFQFSAVSKWTLSVKKFKERERWQAIVVAHDNKLMLVDWEYCRIDKLIWVRFFLLMERRVNLYLTNWNSWVG